MIAYLTGIVGGAIGFCLSGLFVVLASKSLLSDLWKLPFLSEIPGRLKSAQIIVLAVGLPVTTLAAVLLGGEQLAACVFVAIAIVPAIAWFLINLWAWRRDSKDTRNGALEIAIERLSRIGAKPPTSDQKIPWSNYVFDVELAKRRNDFDPPPI